MSQGGSNVWSIPGVIDALVELNPKTVIDIGAGYGKYGMLCWEYLKDLEWIDAVEPNYADVVENISGYTHIYEKKIQEFVPENNYDVALLIAVMCKFDKADGLSILKKIKKYSKYIVLTIEKKQHGGQTQWYPEDFPGAEIRKLPHEWLIII